jgi:hypothetical protein
MNSAVLMEWKSWADRLRTASLYYKQEFYNAASAMPAATVEELGEFYQRAQRENHITQINMWLKSTSGAPPMGQEEKGIRNLIYLFDHLGRYGHQPFFDRSLLRPAELHPATPDWSKLPANLAFLAEPAEQAQKFSHVFSEAGREHIRDSITSQEKAQLEFVAEQVRNVGFKTVKAWYNQLGTWEHIEALLVFNLIGALDALGLKYYD